MTYPGAPGEPEQGADPGSPATPGYPNLPPPGAMPPPGATPPPPPGYGPQPGYSAPPPAGYPAAPPPGYPAAPGYAPYGMAPKKRRRWPWIVLGTVIVLVIVLVVVGIVFGHEGSATPRQALDKFWTAVTKHDTSKADNLVCNGKKLPQSFKEAIPTVTGYDVGAETGSGDSRTFVVTVHRLLDGLNSDLVVPTVVKKQTGKWYVCDFAP